MRKSILASALFILVSLFSFQANAGLKAVVGTQTGSAGSVGLGTSVSAANPSIIGDVTTGFYTAGSGKVDVAISGVKVIEWTSTGENIVPKTGLTIAGLNAISFSSNDSTSGGTIAIGPSALASTSGSSALSDVAIGYQAATLLTTGVQSVAIGYQALANVTTGGGNTAVGYRACNAVSTTQNLGGITCIGRSAGSLDNGSTGNVYIGDQAGLNNVSGGENVYIGRQAGILATSSSNTVIGLNSMTAVTSGGSNTIVGQDGGKFLGTTSHDNTLMGQSVYKQNTGAAASNYSTCIGSSACGKWNASGDAHNIAIGWNAMLGNANFTSSTGTANVAIGDQAGLNWTTAAASILIGQGNPAVNSTTIQNSTLIGYNVAPNLTTGASNICIGHTSCNGLTNGHDNISIGNSSALASGAVGNINIGGVFTWIGNLISIGGGIIVDVNVPTISSGFGSSPSVTHGVSNGAFTVNVGTGGTASSGVIAFTNAAANNWICFATDITNSATFVTVSTPTSTTSITLTNYSRTTGLLIAWTASDIIQVSCHGVF